VRRLLIRPGALGDFVVSLPALEALRAEYTEVWTASAHVPLARFADRARSIANSGLDLLELGRAPAALHETLASFDSIVSWYGSAREEFREAAAGLPFQFLAALPDEHGLPAQEFYARQAESLGARVESRTPRLAIPRTNADPYVAIHPFSGGAQKCWPLARYIELAKRLNGRVCFTAGPGDRLPEDALPEDVAVRRFDDLWELAVWLGNSECFIGNDSGPAHLAAAAGAPVLSIFGPSDERIWAPKGARAVRVMRAADNGVWPAVDEVLAALVELRRCNEENS